VANIAEWLTQSMAAQGTRHAFLIPGFLLGPLNEALAKSSACRPVVCAHELGAAYAADGFARASGTPGWCLAISAPGASNLLTGAIAARLDHQRVLYLVGDVPTANAGRSAFQDGGEPGGRDLALFSQAVPCARAARTAAEASSRFAEILARMSALPPGPAFLSLPRDVQAMEASAEILGAALATQPCLPSAAALDSLLAALASAKRPALLAGEMAGEPGFSKHLLGFAERHRLPVASTMPAKGLFPETHSLSLGCFGYGGSPRAREALLGTDNDFLIALGVSFNERNTLQWDKRLFEGRQIARVLPWQNGERHDGVLEIVANPGAVLASLEDRLAPFWDERRPMREAWIESLAGHPLAAPIHRSAGAQGLHPAEIVATLRAQMPQGTKLFVDAGLCRRAVGQWWTCTEPGELYTSPVTAPMGWGVAASIGGQLARPAQPVVALAGDGSMLMHGSEMVTAVRYEIPVIWVVNNNAALGTVWQRAPTPEASRLTLAPRIDWAAQAEVWGAQGFRAETTEQLATALRAAGAARRPAIIDVRGTLDFAPEDSLFGGTAHGEKAPY